MSRFRLLLALVAVASFTLPSAARETDPSYKQQRTAGQRPTYRIATEASDRPLVNGLPLARTQRAALDTFVLATFGFENAGGGPDEQGWYGLDLTAQPDTFWHVASAVELDGGTFGNLLPLKDAKSLWCGVSDQNPIACGYATAPGVGTGWRQYFTSRKFARSGDVAVSYIIWWDSEPGYDQTSFQYLDKNGEWISPPGQGRSGFPYYDGQGLERETLVLADSLLPDSLQMRFRFTSDGAWNDEDGLWPSDGGALIDSLVTVDDTGWIDYQDFEGEPDGALITNDGDWQASTPVAYGDHSALYRGLLLVQEDPCYTNLEYLWGFLEGSAANYACGGFPEQVAVPFEKITPLRTLYMNNVVVSPVIDWTVDEHGTPVPPDVAGGRLEFDVYRDLPLDNIVLYQWAVRAIVDGCPTDWDNHNLLGYGDQKDWFRESQEIGSLIPTGATGIQVYVGAFDGCPFWCNVYATGECHSHAPLIDNVRVIRVDTQGPLWGGPLEYYTRPDELFQDNFAEDGTKTGVVRIDMAKNILPSATPGIQPGDSATVFVAHPYFGLDHHATGDPSSGPAVYCHVKDVSPAKSGAALSDDLVRWPVVSTGGGWTVLQCDTSFNRLGFVVDEQFCIDLNDSLFTPGDTIEYFFSARDGSGETNYWGELTGVVTTLGEAQSLPMEVTCLPANGAAGLTDILYVDDYDGHGAEPFFQSAFALIGIKPDRYDVRAPSSNVGNGPGSRVKDVIAQLAGCYRKIVWNSGSLGSGTIGDGTGNPELSDDFAMLFEFIDQHPEGGGLYISGNDVAEEWVTLTGTSATALRNAYMNFNLIDGDHIGLGQSLSPLVLGLPGSCFDDGVPDTLIAFGGCPTVSDFDVLQATGLSVAEMGYGGSAAAAAVLGQVTANAVGDTARVLLSGFSYHRIRDDVVQSPVDRVDHLIDILRWLDNEVPTPTSVPDLRLENRLAQNHPNPFNPSTTIRYSIAQRGHVRLTVYNVAGQVVATLVNEVQSPRAGGFDVTWRGETRGGNFAASGVYFYRLQAPGFAETRRMVLIK